MSTWFLSFEKYRYTLRPVWLIPTQLQTLAWADIQR